MKWPWSPALHRCYGFTPCYGVNCHVTDFSWGFQLTIILSFPPLWCSISGEPHGGEGEGAEGVMETNVSTEPQLCKNRRWCHWRWRGPRDQGLIVTGKGIFQWQFKNPCTKSMYLQIGLFGRPIHPQNAQLPFLVLFCIFPCLRNVRGLWLWLVWMFLILYKINSPDWKEGELKWKTVAEIDCFDGTTAEDCSPPLT